jgi:hypothetical protein
MENIQEQNQEQVLVQSVPTTVAYLDLVKKLRQLREQTEPVQEECKQEPKPKVRGFKNVSKPQKQTNTRPQNQTDAKPRMPRLSPEEYQKRLVGCQTVFMNELKIYLREEVKTKEKETSEAGKLEETKTTNKPQPKKVQMTNLEQIQSGSRSVNIVHIINSRVEASKMVYFENLLKNRQMNFVEYLSEFMSKYDVRTTYKSLNTILLHSPYIIV